MTMSVVKPITFTSDMLLSTTATEAEPAWVSGTGYAKGARVWHTDSVTGLQRRWESLVSTNLTTPSSLEKLHWLDLGPSNKQAMFDSSISTQTTTSGDLVVEFAAGDVISSLALLNLVGDYVTVEVTSGGEVVYSKIENLQGGIIADWWDYYFTEDDQISQALFTDLPLYYSGTVKATIKALTGIGASVGHAVFGTRQEIGYLRYGAASGIIDYSKKDTDEFGETTFVRRAFADELSGQVFVDNGQLNRIKRLLRDLRATPCLWIGLDDDTYTEVLVVFGWYRQHRIVIEYPGHSLIDLEIEGLT